MCDEYVEMQRFLDERPELKAQLQGILMRMKVDTYRWNDERLVDELREQFWKKASSELKADWDAGRFDLSLFDPAWRDRLASDGQVAPRLYRFAL